MRKLQYLSLAQNKIENFQKIIISEPLVNLVELDLSGNSIKTLVAVKNTPNLNTLILSNNPLSMVFPEALNELSKLRQLYINEVKFKKPIEGDLIFLKAVENQLCDLQLNSSFPKKNLD